MIFYVTGLWMRQKNLVETVNRYEKQEEERKKFLLQKMTPKNTFDEQPQSTVEQN